MATIFKSTASGGLGPSSYRPRRGWDPIVLYYKVARKTTPEEYYPCMWITGIFAFYLAAFKVTRYVEAHA